MGMPNLQCNTSVHKTIIGDGNCPRVLFFLQEGKQVIVFLLSLLYRVHLRLLAYRCKEQCNTPWLPIRRMLIKSEYVSRVTCTPRTIIPTSASVL